MQKRCKCNESERTKRSLSNSFSCTLQKLSNDTKAALLQSKKRFDSRENRHTFYKDGYKAALKITFAIVKAQEAHIKELKTICEVMEDDNEWRRQQLMNRIQKLQARAAHISNRVDTPSKPNSKKRSFSQISSYASPDRSITLESEESSEESEGPTDSGDEFVMDGKQDYDPDDDSDAPSENEKLVREELDLMT